MFQSKALKRVAFTVATAMGFALLAASPSLAVPGVHQADTLTQTVSSSTTSVGMPVSTVLNQSFIATGTESLVVTASLNSAPAGNVALPVLTAAGGTDVNVGSHSISGGNLISTTIANAPGYTTGYTTATLTPTHVGTYVIKFTPSLGTSTGVLQASALTWTITVSATPAVTAENSVTTLNASTGVVNTGVDTAVSASSTASVGLGSQVATIVVVSKNNLNTDLSANTSLTATVSGPGLLGFGGNTGTNNLAVATIPMTGRALTGQIGQNLIALFADGTSGTATVSIYAGNTLLATKSVTFSGPASTYTVTNSINNLQVGANGVNGSPVSNAVKVRVTDSNSTPVADGTVVYATSATPAVATIVASQPTVGGYAYFAVQGITAGSSVVTFANALVSPTITKTTTVNVASSVASTVTLSFDKASYVPGEKMVLTLSAKSANGSGVSDGTYTNFLTAPATSNVALQGALPVASPVFVNGEVSYTLYAPLTGGTVHVLATTGVSANLALLAQSKSLDASATVVADTSVTDALKLQIQLLQDAYNKAQADNAKALADAAALAAEAKVEAAQAQAVLKDQLAALASSNTALQGQLSDLSKSNSSALAMINSLNKTISALNKKLSTKTIVCVKAGSTSKTVKGVNPVCPTGYKKK